MIPRRPHRRHHRALLGEGPREREREPWGTSVVQVFSALATWYFDADWWQMGAEVDGWLHARGERGLARGWTRRRRLLYVDTVGGD